MQRTIKSILSGLLTFFLICIVFCPPAFAEEGSTELPKLEGTLASEETAPVEKEVPAPEMPENPPASVEEPVVPEESPVPEDELMIPEDPPIPEEKPVTPDEPSVPEEEPATPEEGPVPEGEPDTPKEDVDIPEQGEPPAQSPESESDQETTSENDNATDNEDSVLSDTEETEDVAEPDTEEELPELPENWSCYEVPENYDLLDIYERIYLGPPLSLSEALRYIELDLCEALNRIADTVDHEDVYVRYNTGLEHSYRFCMAEVAAVFCAIEDWADYNSLKSKKLSTEQVEMLRSIYWNMSSISPIYRKNVSYSYSAENPGEILEHECYHVQIDVGFTTASEFLSAPTPRQQEIMDMLLSEPIKSEFIKICSGELSDFNYGTGEIIESLPDYLDPLRRKVVEKACSLVGKVSYFWGGKSEITFWDERWGVPKAVVDDGTGQLGDISPFGLDCAGFVTWVFINAAEDPNVLGIIGHGVQNQLNSCRPIDISELNYGDMVFFYGTETMCGHVGIVVGFTAEGEPLVCHCSSSGTGDVRIEPLYITGMNLAGSPDLFYQLY